MKRTAIIVSIVVAIRYPPNMKAKTKKAKRYNGLREKQSTKKPEKGRTQSKPIRERRRAPHRGHRASRSYSWTKRSPHSPYRFLKLPPDRPASSASTYKKRSSSGNRKCSIARNSGSTIWVYDLPFYSRQLA